MDVRLREGSFEDSVLLSFFPPDPPRGREQVGAWAELADSLDPPWEERNQTALGLNSQTGSWGGGGAIQ